MCLYDVQPAAQVNTLVSYHPTDNADFLTGVTQVIVLRCLTTRQSGALTIVTCLSLGKLIPLLVAIC